MKSIDWCGTGQLVEDMRKEREAASQNDPISHTIAPGSTQTPHPYPSYAQEEIDRHRGSGE